MAVMTTSSKKIDTTEQQSDTKKKSLNKTRPITATLDHPLILDIKLLKKLDMTTFTKKGLIALSKFCGISLIRKTDCKRKLSKSIKSIQYSKRQSGGDSVVGQYSDTNKKSHTKIKRKPLKQIPKIKPRVNFKLDNTNWLEDSSDVICKRQEKLTKNNQKLTKPVRELKRVKGTNSMKKDVIDYMLGSTLDNLIPEPCKTCNRSEYPERFHSHPKASPKVSDSLKRDKLLVKSTEKVTLEEKFKSSVTTKDCDDTEIKKTDGNRKRNQSLRAKDTKDFSVESPQKSLSSFEELSPETRTNIASPSNSTSSNDQFRLFDTKHIKLKNKKSSQSITKSNKDLQILKRMEEKNNTLHKETDQISALSPVDDAMKYVTGCYICGKQISPKLRIKHEENCIIEWRTQNNLLSPDKRKPEPKRPDYRFTASGDVDCEGTFESIWANHKDSLVPCKKCGRTFFPDRIERHENCCNNLPLRVKYKH